MGQQLFKVNLNIDETAVVDSDTTLSSAGQNDISFFYSLESDESNNDHPISKFQRKYTEQIRNSLSILTKPVDWERLDAEIDDLLLNNIFKSIDEQKKKVEEDTESTLSYKQQLRISLMKKVKDDNSINLIFEDNNDSDQEEQKANDLSEQLAYFSTQSLMSIILILTKSVEKTDPTIIQYILTVVKQLCEQLPMKDISSMNYSFFKSWQPLIDYIQELSLTTDPIVSKQTIEILLRFFLAKRSFKDILSLLNRLIFNTTDIYNVRTLFIQLNKNLTKTIDQWEKQNQNTISKEITDIVSFNYLKSLGLYPNTQLLEFNEQLFTGQLISSIILSYIDIENIINSSTKQLKLRSISFDFHPDTFKHLFNIIEQLTTNTTTIHILTICLRLFTSHLQFLSHIKSDDNQIKLNTYVTDIELKKWFEFLLKLVSNESTEQINICKEASKALIYVINIRSSITEKLSIYHQYIIQNKHSILIEQILLELNKNEILTNWIEFLFDDNNGFVTMDILHSFIGLYFNEEYQKKSEIQQILLSFQQLLLFRLIDQYEKNNKTLDLSSLISQYLTYLFTNYKDQISMTDDLFNSILVGLCLMTKTDKLFLYETIQPIFLSILPLLAEYYLKNLNNEFLSLLIGKISYVLIIGSPEDSLETKYTDQLKLPIFTGGCITNKSDYLLNSNLAIENQFQFLNETKDDNTFLMSIYNNVGEGAQLISKLKLFVKNKPRLLLKSIEQQADDACAAVFAVYIKYYRRLNLAQSEFSRIDQNKPSSQLLSLYEYTNRIQTLFINAKAQGGDCNDLYQQIKIKTLFLLLSVKENDLIPITTEDIPSTMTDIQSNTELYFQRQQSHWSKAKHTLKLLRNLFQACLRLKNFLLEKRQINENKYHYQTLLQRTIDNFICEHFHTTSDEMQLEIDQLETCLHRQHERAIIRLMTYRFIKTILSNGINNDQSCRILLPYLKQTDSKWSYFDGIQSSNNYLKEGISDTYYSIIKLILSSSLQSEFLVKTNFYLLNISYESIDLCYLCHHQIIETFFITFVSFVTNSDQDISLGLRLIAFNWFRLFVFKLCENIQIDKLREILNKVLQEEQNLVFNTLILNELKNLKQINETMITNSEELKLNSLKDIALGWFLQENKTNVSILSNHSQIELCINQYLVLLLRCVYFYPHVVSICANIDYLEESLYIYYHCQSNITRLLVVKFLRYIIPFIQDSMDGRTKNLIETFLITVISSIDENTIVDEILVELIYMYRTIMSIDSPWRIIAAQFIFDSIQSHLNLKSIETNDTHHMNKLLASLRILGGYIEPYRVGSIVTVKNGNNTNGKSSFALIIEIDSNTDKEEVSYTLQYLQTNQIESVSKDRLQLQTDVPPLNLFSLPISKDSILDALGYFIQIDTSAKNESVVLLELKRRCVSVLYHLLNDTTLVTIFMAKPYASAIAKLCFSDLLTNIPNLRAFNQQHLEQYCLSLDKCEKLKQIIETENKDDDNDLPHTSWNGSEINRDPLIIDALSASASKYSGWKPYATEEEIEEFKRGRYGNEEISLVPIPRCMADIEAPQQCGIKHRFRGRIEIQIDSTRPSFPSFIVDNLQLSEGKWYYCIRLPVAGLVQIGWATTGFSPSSNGGVGDDDYSWSYDGSRGVFFNNAGYQGQFNDIRWKKK